MSDEVTSPPYPGEGATADGLYTAFGELQKWVSLYRDTLNQQCSQEIIPAAIPLPDRRAYTAQPVLYQYSHLLFMRRLREEWDHLVRSFESDWANQVCVRHQVMLVAAAATTVNNAFVSYELQEARRARAMEHTNRIFESVLEVIDREFTQKNYDPKPLTEG